MSERFQFKKHSSEVFKTREEAVSYINDICKPQALVGEPVMVMYGTEENPNVILAIGSSGNGTLAASNRLFMIDTANIIESVETIKEMTGTDTETLNGLVNKVGLMLQSIGLNGDGTYQVDYEDELLKKASSINEAVKLLSAKVQENSEHTTLSVENTDSVALTLDTEGKSNNLKADVVVSTYGSIDSDYNDNIIVKLKDGLFASVDLNYNEYTGELTFTASKMDNDGTVGVRMIEKKFNLGKHGELKAVRYNKADETIEFVYTDSEGNEVVKSADAEDLINEWDVENPVGNAVRLTKTRVVDGKDLLSADVIISDGGFNILKKSATTGGLYVNGSASNLRFDTDKTVEQAIKELQDGKDDWKAEAVSEANAYTDGKIAALNTSVENAAKNAEEAYKKAEAAADAIAVINGDNETAGSIKKALADAKAYADSKDDLVKADVEKNAAAIEILNGNEAEPGSVKKALADAKAYTDEVLANHDDEALKEVSGLRDALNAEIKRATITGRETNTLSLEITQAESGTTLSGDVKLSTITGNIISKQDGGLFAYVTLRYNAAENALYFNNGTPTDTKIQLSSVGLIDNAYYDTSNKAIVIVFNDENNTTVRIPVGDLIPTLAVGRESDSAVILRLVNESNLNTLYGDVVVSDSTANILQKRDGALYVRGMADNIKYGSDSNVEVALNELYGNVSGNLTEAKAYTDKKVAEEAARAQAAEQANKALIDTINGDGEGSIKKAAADALTQAKSYTDEALANHDTESDERISALETAVSANTSAIAILNGNEAQEGSVKKAAADALAAAKEYSDNALQAHVTEANGKFDALESGLTAETERAQAAEKVNADAIAILNGNESQEGSVKKALADAKAYTDEALANHDTESDERISALETAVSAHTDALTILNGDENQEGSVRKAAADTLAAAKEYADEKNTYVTAMTLNGNVVKLTFNNIDTEVSVDLTPMVEAAVAAAVAQAKAEISYKIVKSDTIEGTVDETKTPREITLDVTNVSNGVYGDLTEGN